MSILKINEIPKVVRKLFQFQSFLPTSSRRTASNKNGEIPKQCGAISEIFQRDNKVLYGKLVETLPQKRKRIKSEKQPIIESVPKEGYEKFEQDFFLKNAKKNTVRVLPPPKKKVKSEEKLEADTAFFGLPVAEDGCSKNLSRGKLESSVLETPNFTEEEMKFESSLESPNERISYIKNENIDRVVSNMAGPSEIIIKNMLSFSIYDSTKSSRVTHKTTPDPTNIISLSARNDRSSLILPSVTRILSATMSEASKKALAIWKEGMIQKLGREGFDAYQKDLFKDGHDLHSSIENSLLQKEYEIPERVKPAFQSVEKVLKDISSISALETHVVHPKLHYRGIADCVATYRGELCLIDWKKSDKRKDAIGSIYDAPTQVASYIGALNADLKYPFEIKKGLVVVAYTNGEEATVHELVQENLFIYWKAWLKRLQKYFVDLKK